MTSQFLIDAYTRSETGLSTPINGLGEYGLRCFFLRRELGKTKAELKASGQYQHLRLTMNKLTGTLEFLEYSQSRMFYKTLEEWVTAQGCTLDDVLYGRQDFDGHKRWITLQELVDRFTPKDQDEPDDVDNLTRLFQKLRANSVPINKIMVSKTVMVPGDVYLME
jgi:hypothetical protein